MHFDLEALPSDFPLPVLYFESIDSTSRYLKDEISSGRIDEAVFCIADRQTGGYGQYGRSWETEASLSPLTCSFSFPFGYSLDKLLYKSVPVALTLQNLLTRYAEGDFQVKWPNDIYSDDAKAAGCLIEVVKSKATKQPFVVFGLGINLSASIDSDYGYVSNLDVYQFLFALAQEIRSLFSVDKDPEIDRILAEWQRIDYFHKDEPVRVFDQNTEQVGIYKGLNRLFQPQVLVDDELKAYSTGQASIRKV